MGLVALVFGSHAQYIEAADYSYMGNRQDRSWTGQQNEYATRWGRSTKPWSRELSGAEQSGFDGNRMGYSTGSGQWANESSGRNWQPRRDPANDSRQFSEWGRERPDHSPVHALQSPEAGQGPDPWGPGQDGQAFSGEQRDPWPGSKQGSDPWGPGRDRRAFSGEQPDPWPEPKDWRKPDGWADRKPASNDWAGQRSGSASWSQGNGSERPYNAYGNTPWYGQSQSERPESSRDYSSGGALPATQNAWGDPWSKKPPRGSVRGSNTYAPGTDASSDRGYWGHTGQTYGENRPWGERRPKKPSRTERQTGSGANTYNVVPSDARQQYGYPSYPGYPDYLGMGEYGSIYGPGYGMGYNPGYYGWGYQQGLGSAPMVGESPWFSF